MNFLINVDFNDTHSLRLVLVDPDPEGAVAVYSAVFDGGSDQELPIFFECPHGAEVWEVLELCLGAYKDFKISEGVE